MHGALPNSSMHEAALCAAEKAGRTVSLRILGSPFPDWQPVPDVLTTTGDSEGTVWTFDLELNDRLRVVSPASNGRT
jgi:hypothetical protein